MQPNRNPARTALFIGLFGLTLTAQVAWAHPRPWAHQHKKSYTKATIVLGKGKPSRQPLQVNGITLGVLDLNIKPKTTEVWIDGDLVGTCDAFDGSPHKLHLSPGPHTLKLVTPDGEDVAREIRVRPGVELDVGLDLR